MGSSYYGDHQGNLGNIERGAGAGAGLSSSSSSSSARRGKKGSSDKPKQPQRGLGVAQLEKIRLHSQLASNYLPSLHHNHPYNPPSYTQEDIRLQTGYSSSSSSFSYSNSSSSPPPYGFQGPHGVMMSLPELDRTNIRYGDHSLSSSIARWPHPGNAGVDMGNLHFVDPGMTARPFFDPGIFEGSRNTTEENRKENSMGSGSQNSESSSSQDIDLELRLSL